MLYQAIILMMQQRLAANRSISGVYYILQGKQSIQTIQDAHLFGLEKYYSVYKHLKKDRFMKTVYMLEETGYLESGQQDNYFTITYKAEQWLQDHQQLLLQHHLNGNQFKQIDDIFFERILLLIQVWTNRSQHNSTFIPIVEDKEIERWVKTFYQSTKQNVSSYLQALYDELTDLLSELSNEDAAIWVSQLTGFQFIGQTMAQLAQVYGVEREEIYIRTTSTNHLFLERVIGNEGSYPLLEAISKIHKQVKLTDSASATRQLLRQNYSLETISDIRKLKINTIYDHLVEISLYDTHFSLHPYVNSSVQQQIYHALQKSKSFRLKDIKENVDDSITYFQIRLVLTRFQRTGERGENE